MKYKINILGVDYTIIFHEEKDWKSTDYEGLCNNRNKTIDIKIQRWSDNKAYYKDYTNKIIWHEIGHAIDHMLPTSITHGEWSAVMGEEFYKVHKVINKITNDINTKLTRGKK